MEETQKDRQGGKIHANKTRHPYIVDLNIMSIV